MATVIQRRRGTTAEHTSFTGAVGELTIDTTKDTAVVHDGAKAGGYPLMREDFANITGQLAGMRNKIINGKMEIAQRGTSFVTPADNTYTLDRWTIYEGTDGTVTVTQQSDAPADNEFQNSLRVAVTTADTSIAAGQYAFLRQLIEGYNVRDLIGRTFTLSFRVRSSKTGVHCIAFRNTGADRSYVAEYTVNSANTWETKTIVVSGGLITAGTWNWTNGGGVSVEFTMAAGTTFQTTTGSWQTGSFLATANQVNCLDSNTNIFAITGVQLEVGGVATPFEHRPIGAELALCQRYGLPAPQARWVAYVTTSGATWTTISFPVTMRAAPTATTNPTFSGTGFSTSGVQNLYTNGVVYSASNAAAGQVDVTVSGGFLSAEL